MEVMQGDIGFCLVHGHTAPYMVSRGLGLCFTSTLGSRKLRKRKNYAEQFLSLPALEP